MYQTKNLGLNITEIDKDSLQAFNFDIDLGDNFKAIDEKTLSHRNITNCLLEVPQDIKLELVDGVVTLKEGSKVYVPNGFEADGVTPKFDKVEIAVDRSNSTTGDGDILLAVGLGGNLLALEAKSFTVTERPESTTGTPLYYNITTNKIEFYDNSIWNSNASFPIAIVERTDNGFTNIKQVFNGMGFVGSTVFALPGVKYSIPDGRNENGSLRNIECYIDTVKTFNFTFSVNLVDSSAPIILTETTAGYLSGVGTFLYGDKPSNPLEFTRWYDVENNYLLEYTSALGWSKKNYCIIGAADIKNKVFNSFTPKQPFHAVDYYDYSTKIAELEAKIQALQTAVEALQGS